MYRALIPVLSLLFLPVVAPLPAWADDETLVIAEPALREVTLTGFTRARARLPLIAEVEGRVLTVQADIGDAIPSDGTFARIDDTFIAMELDEITVEQSRLREQIAYDEREAKRYRVLAQKNNAAAVQLDTAEQTLRNNRHALQTLDVKRRILDERRARTWVKAPPGWRVTGREVEPGQWVSVGQRLGEAASFDPVLVPLALTLQELDALRSLEQPRLLLPELDREIDAAIYRINPGFDPETRKIAVDLSISGSSAPSRGGVRALLRIALPERSGAIELPAAAVRSSFEEHWVQPEDGEPIRVLLLGSTDGPSGDHRLRVSAPELRPGDHFRVWATDSE